MERRQAKRRVTDRDSEDINFWKGAGHVLDYPHLTTIEPPHCLVFNLVVDSLNGKQSHIFSVVELGLKAQIDYYYLRPQAQVRIEGHLENDRSHLPKVKTARRHIVYKHAIIVAEFIAFGNGCDFDNGRRKMSEILEVAQERGDPAVERLELFRKFSLMMTPPEEQR